MSEALDSVKLTKLVELETIVQAHIQECDQLVSNMDNIVNIQKENTEAIKANAKAIDRLVSETEGVIRVHNEVVSAVRVGSAMQKFGKWIITWPLIGAGIYTILEWWK